MRRVYGVLGSWANGALTLRLHPEGVFDLAMSHIPEASLDHAGWAVTVRTPWGRETLFSTRLPVEDVREEAVVTPLGPAHQVSITHRPSRSGCALRWRAQVYQQRPHVTVQVAVAVPAPGFALERLQPLQVRPPSGQVTLPGLNRGWRFFVEGWHSWSFTGVLRSEDRQPTTRLARFDAPPVYDVAHPPPKARGHFLSHRVGVLIGEGKAPALVLGWVREWDFAGLVEVQRLGEEVTLAAWADGEGIPLTGGAEIWSEPLLAQFIPPETPDPLAAFAEALACFSGARVPTDVPVGWCSWYHFYRRVRPADVRRNVDALKAVRDTVPVDVVQIDDGYEAEVGDWLEQRPDFAGEMPALAETIREAGFRPGLWLAPFILSPRARLARAHPDWVLRDGRGRPVNAGFLWNTFTTALDVTHPGVEDYLRQVVETVVHRWGYTYLKLDFLYAAALPGQRHRKGLTRVQALRHGLKLIREVAGEDAFLLGCGCPLGPAVGLVDAMRIGPDIALHWRPRVYGLSWPWRGKVTYPAAVNAIRNTLTRSAYHQRLWWNDPDCVLVRVRDNRLTPDEVQAWLSVVGLTGGLVAWSDDLPTVPPERRAWLAALLPPQPDRGFVLDLMDRTMPQVVVLPLQRPWGTGVTVGVFNWTDRPCRQAIPLSRLGLESGQRYHAFDFWHEEYFRVVDDVLLIPELKPHSGRVIGLKPVRPAPHLAASTFHISQGGEVRSWTWTPPVLRFRVVIGRKAEGRVLVGTGGLHATCEMPGVQLTPVAEDVIAVHCVVDGEREVRLTLR